VKARQIDPAEISPGEFAVLVRRSVDTGAKLVVIDSLKRLSQRHAGRSLSQQPTA
jgi:circadian clock protein KaiC